MIMRIPIGSKESDVAEQSGVAGPDPHDPAARRVYADLRDREVELHSIGVPLWLFSPVCCDVNPVSSVESEPV